MDRRTFVGTKAATAVTSMSHQGLSRTEPPITPTMPKRKLGKTGVDISVLILGGVVGMASLEQLRINAA